MSLYRMLLKEKEADEDRKGKKKFDEEEEEEYHAPLPPRLLNSLPNNEEFRPSSYFQSVRSLPEMQLGFLRGVSDFNRANGYSPFEDQESVEEFCRDWLMVGASGHEITSLGEGLMIWASGEASNVADWTSLSPLQEQVFDLACTIWCIERKTEDEFAEPKQSSRKRKREEEGVKEEELELEAGELSKRLKIDKEERVEETKEDEVKVRLFEYGESSGIGRRRRVINRRYPSQAYIRRYLTSVKQGEMSAQQGATKMLRYVQQEDPLAIICKNVKRNFSDGIVQLKNVLDFYLGYTDERVVMQCAECMIDTRMAPSEMLDALRTISGLGRPMNRVVHLLELAIGAGQNQIALTTVTDLLLEYLNVLASVAAYLR